MFNTSQTWASLTSLQFLYLPWCEQLSDLSPLAALISL
jgi:hypothetical protein